MRKGLTKAELDKLPADGKRLYNVWSKLREGPMRERELFDQILAICGYHPGDWAAASVIRLGLGLSGALETVQNGSRVEYQAAAEFKAWGPAGPGTEAFDRQTREQAEELHRGREQATQAAIERGPGMALRREMIVLIDERIERRIEELRDIRPSTDLIRTRLGLSRKAA